MPQNVEAPGAPHAVVEHHPGCPAHLPHGVNDSDGHLLACHATVKEAQDIALHLDIGDASPAPTPGGNTADSPSVTAVTIPAARNQRKAEAAATGTWEDVELLAVGEWNLSTGPASFTVADLQGAVGAADCPSVGKPVLKLGHSDPRFDGEPAIGWVDGMRLNASMTKVLGDYAGMPEWLGEILPSAYPKRSVEGQWNFTCQQGHLHPFVITAVALLGTTPPGVGIIGSLNDIAVLYGADPDPQPVPAAAAAPPPAPLEIAMNPQVSAAGTVTTIDDVRREFYEEAPWSRWIVELQLDPLTLIVSDDSTGSLYRVPVTIDPENPGEVTFGADEVVLVQYITAPTQTAEAAKGGPGRRIAAAWASRDTSRAGVRAAWDSAAQVSNLGDEPTAAQLSAMYALPAGTKSGSKLPHHAVAADGKVGDPDPDGCSAAIGAINGARGGLAGVSDADKKKAYDHVAAHMTAMDMEPPELTAAAGPADPAGLAGWPVEDRTTTAARLARLEAIRAAAGDTDADENVNKLLASLDATLDQASQLSAGIDRASVDEPTGQALDLITAAEALADQLMELLGIYDPDDAAAVAAGGAHPPMSGEHEHPHSAFGAQGGDKTHTHMHAHAGDAVHRHAHGAVSSAPPPPSAAPAAAAARKEGDPEVEFTAEQMAAIRTRLGIKEGEEVTPDAIAGAFAAPEFAAAAGAPDLKPKEGVYLVDSSIIDEWAQRARAGDAAVRELHVAQRDVILAEAIREGKFPQSRREHYEAMWDADPDGAREHVEALAAGLVVPVGGPVGRPGYDPEMGGDYDAQEAYRKLYPDDKTAASAARGGHRA